MATVLTPLAPDISTDANFRAILQAINNALTGFGWVQTADTGQLNPLTAVHPAGSFQTVGYMMWRMGDALQATYPVFMKMIFGSEAANQVNLKVQIGVATDGVGGFASPGIASVLTPIVMANNSLTQYQCAFSGDASNFRMHLWFDYQPLTQNSRALVVNVERFKDLAGVDTNEGAGVYAGSAVQQGKYQGLSFAAGLVAAGPSYDISNQGVGAICFPNVANYLTFGKQLVIPLLWNCNGVRPMRGLVGYTGSAYTQGQTFQASLMGAMRTFLASGFICSPGGNTSIVGALLWE